MTPAVTGLAGGRNATDFMLDGVAIGESSPDTVR